MTKSYMPNHAENTCSAAVYAAVLPQEPGPFLTHAFAVQSWQSNWPGGHFGHLAVSLAESVMARWNASRAASPRLRFGVAIVHAIDMQGTATWSKLRYEVKGRAWPPTGEV